VLPKAILHVPFKYSYRFSKDIPVLIERLGIKTYGDAFFTSAIYGVRAVSSRLGHFKVGERAGGTYWASG
jgi:hypothetical protein